MKGEISKFFEQELFFIKSDQDHHIDLKTSLLNIFYFT